MTRYHAKADVLMLAARVDILLLYAGHGPTVQKTASSIPASGCVGVRPARGDGTLGVACWRQCRRSRANADTSQAVRQMRDRGKARSRSTGPGVAHRADARVLPPSRGRSEPLGVGRLRSPPLQRPTDSALKQLTN